MLHRMRAETTTVTVVGLGKMGLPLAAQYASKGMNVIGSDIRESVVKSVNAGRSHVLEEPGLAEAVAEAVSAGRLKATVDTAEAVKAADAGVDFSGIDSATQAIARGLRRGVLVVYETTLPVGTTRQRLGAMLEEGS